MRTIVAGLCALAVLAALAPTASAQTPFTGLTLTVGAVTGPDIITEDDETRVKVEGSADVPVSVALGCLDILQSAGSAQVEVTMEQPTWMVVTPLVLTFSPDLCAASTTGIATQAGNVRFTLKPEAPGVLPQTLKATAAFENPFGALADEGTVTFGVGYKSSYTVVADTTFPLQVRGGQATFNITVTQASNARSMVMFEQVKESAGKISGLASVPYDTPPMSKTFKVTYKAPPGAWSEAKVDFTTYGHYLLDYKTGPFVDGKPTSWTFVNAEPDSGETNASPMSGWPLLVAVLGAAAVAARRTRQA